MKPLSILSCHSTDVTLEFVTNSLFIGNSYNAILIVLIHFIKKKHYIPYSKNENKSTIEAIT